MALEPQGNLPEALRKIQPAYPELGGYSQRGERVLFGPDRALNESAFPSDEPIRPFDMEEDAKWAAEIWEATKREGS